MGKNSALFLAWTTFPNQEEANAMARQLVENSLAACCQVSGPIISHYRWEGKIQQDLEYRLAIKFIEARAVEVEKWVLSHHSYKTPQWMAVKMNRVAEGYMDWALGMDV